MNIIYIHQYFATLSSSTSIRSFIFAKKLVEKNCHVTVITSDAFMKQEIPILTEKGVRHYDIDGIKVLAIKSNYSNSLGKFRRIIEFLKFMIRAYFIGAKLKNNDMIFATSTPLTIGIPAMALSKKLKIPFVFEVRDLWPEAPVQLGYIKNRLVKTSLFWLEKTIYEKAAHIICLSTGMAAGVAKLNIPSEKISVIPNLSDLELFSDKNIQYELRKKRIQDYGLKEKFLLTHIGAMGEANGLDYIINAAKILQTLDKNDTIRIMIVGDGKVKNRLVEQVENDQLTNILFVDMIKKEEVPTYLSMANVTITSFLPKPILATNSPNKFFDSMAAGIPIIVNSSGWTKEVVERYGIGYYVDPYHPYQLAELLLDLSTQKEKLAMMKEKIKIIAHENYDKELLSDRFFTILKSTAKSTSK